MFAPFAIFPALRRSDFPFALLLINSINAYNENTATPERQHQPKQPIHFSLIRVIRPAAGINRSELGNPPLIYRLHLPASTYMDSPALVGPGGAASLSPTSPVSIRSLGGAANGGLKRKRSAGGVVSAIDSSPGSIGDDNDIGDHNDRKRQPGVKRACNECRQQKVSHAVSPPPLPLLLPTTCHIVASTTSTLVWSGRNDCSSTRANRFVFNL